ncbi:MAG: hypothetical protein IPO29_19925 [Anaerolineae bacterium]|nr:hypothetical protein [Anaerolineae bacterium]
MEVAPGSTFANKRRGIHAGAKKPINQAATMAIAAPIMNRRSHRLRF